MGKDTADSPGKGDCKTSRHELRKLQSAMEYLMTYGWSILLLAIVVAGLFELGVFTGGSGGLLPMACIAQSGFICSNPQMNTTGNLSITFGELYGQQLQITGLACSNSTTAPIADSFILKILNVQPGAEAGLTFECPPSKNRNQGIIGGSSSGTLWIRYNLGSLQGIISEIGSFTAQSATSNAVGVPGGNSQGEFYFVNQFGGVSGFGNVLLIGSSASNVVGAVDGAPTYFRYPEGIALSGSTAYVVNYLGGSSGDGNILEINLATNTITGGINSAAFDGPYSIALSGSTAYVVNKNGGSSGAGNVFEINLATNTITGGINSAAFDDPSGIALSGSTAYVVNEFGSIYSTGNVLTLDISTNTITGTVDPGYGFYNPTDITLSGTNAYVISTGTVISIVDLVNNQITGSVSSAEFDDPHGIAVSGSTAYVVNENGGSSGTGNVFEIDLTTGKTIGSINSAAFDYPTDIAISGSTAYITNGYATATGNILILNISSDQITGAIGSSSFVKPIGIALSGSTAYVMNTGPSNILIVDTSTGQVTGAITSSAFVFNNGGSDFNQALITLSGSTAYVMNTGGGTSQQGNVLIVNTLTGQVTGAIDSNAIYFSKHFIRACFVGNTTILMANGTSERIDNLSVGDVAESYNLRTHSMYPDTIDKVLRYNVSEVYVINGKVTVDPAEYFYVVNSTGGTGNWTATPDLRIGETILGPASNSLITVDSISNKSVPGGILVYDLRFKNGNNFIANGYLADKPIP